MTGSPLSGIQHNTMASTPRPPVSQGKRDSVGSYAGGGNASLLVETAKGGLRRSTPDSEPPRLFLRQMINSANVTVTFRVTKNSNRQGQLVMPRDSAKFNKDTLECFT
jgi:hypothetical protein